MPFPEPFKVNHSFPTGLESRQEQPLLPGDMCVLTGAFWRQSKTYRVLEWGEYIVQVGWM